MSEELRVDGAFRNGSAVDGEIFAGPPAAELMYDFRYILLSHAAFPAYQHGKVRRSDSNGDFKRPVQGGIIAYDVKFVL